MSKISIVGVEGSGKTTLMAAFGEKYERPDRYGYFLAAETPQTFHTVKLLADRMRRGEWPNATVNRTLTNLEWTLYRRQGMSNESLCAVSFLDFAGEIYRLAFGEHAPEERLPFEAQIDTLREHIGSSGALLVLVNLKDVIDGDLSSEKTRETLWISRNIVDYAVKTCGTKHVALAFSQYEVYRQAIDAAGGLRAAYAKYLPHIESLYPGLDVFAVSAVDRTVVNASGQEIPAQDFMSNGLEGVLEWIVSTVPGHEAEIQNRRELPQTLVKSLREDADRLRKIQETGRGRRLDISRRMRTNLDRFGELPPDETRNLIAVEELVALGEFANKMEKEGESIARILDSVEKKDFESARRELSAAVDAGTIGPNCPKVIGDLISEAVERAEREDRRRHKRIVVAVAACLGIVLLAVVGVVQSNRVKAAREQAEIRRAVEETRRAVERKKQYTRDALVAFVKKDWYKGYELAQSADQEDSSIQFYMGVCHGFGYGGVEKNDQKAVEWYRRSAERGNENAQYNLGIRLDVGKGCKMDKKEAVLWFRKSADQGYVDAFYMLGRAYANGYGVEKDDETAVGWYKKAAANGDEWSQKELKERNLSW